MKIRIRVTPEDKPIGMFTGSQWRAKIVGRHRFDHLRDGSVSTNKATAVRNLAHNVLLAIAHDVGSGTRPLDVSVRFVVETVA
jgi:hypothetical protein